MSRDPRIVIIGAGMAGIATAYVFTQAGFTNFTMVEKGSDVGGVWHWNRYPGLTCDVPSQIYQYGFAPKPDWSHLWAAGPDIQGYHRDVVDNFGLREHLRLNTEVTSATYSAGEWTLTTADGQTMVADFVVCATGVLHHPNIPEIPGRETFAGPVVHTAQWDPDVNLTGQRVAVIGTGSTGVQVVSALQPDAASVIHFARSPQWILWAPMALRQPRALSAMLRRWPRLLDVMFDRLQWVSGILADVVTKPSWRRTLVQAYARASLRLQIRDRELRTQLTPDYEPLCKRQVVSGSYYRAITASNARLVSSPITEITANGIRTRDGEHHDVDAIVLATGFHPHNYMRPMSIVGRDGVTLDEVWVKGPRAYRMTALPGFPNLFTVLGPNSPTGSIPLQYSAELTARYIVSWLNDFRDGIVNEIEVTQEATDDFNAAVAQAMGPTVWNTGCNSWYFAEDGTIDLWPFDRATLTEMLTEPDPAHYRLS